MYIEISNHGNQQEANILILHVLFYTSSNLRRNCKICNCLASLGMYAYIVCI